ncbi:hypothetical protein Phi18:2_gp41 [Cellulophaga phage phi18:2]|uniref:Uncharacterized protein n=2 Tax=Cellulophaga phage phi18:1 TaxID=1327982 RepID=S0A0U9_9CAUD|nr:hypothetical protein Phi18:1_gp43 [Cellulophaga phage phi18:1]AGO48490.1 hypothetical protein Phi18:1_gp43 [Cellulophaga phage phi18:1]AGO49204.1 hypothetical protein Phi18:2_gp41 [Cellulophaga phage phi18:2]
MNYEIEIKSVLNPDKNIWAINYKYWAKGSCRCSAKTGSLEVVRLSKPSINDCIKAVKELV